MNNNDYNSTRTGRPAERMYDMLTLREGAELLRVPGRHLALLALLPGRPGQLQDWTPYPV
jgi:hypothetical protein